MATIASLGVSLTARIGNFEKGFKKARRIAGDFASDLTQHVGTLAKYGAALAGVAAGAASVLVKQQLEAVDATSKLSRTLGLSTEELVGYEHAASLAGVESDKLSAAILKINKNTELTGRSTSARLEEVANHYAGISGAAEKAQYLTKMFGKSGLAMGALFEQGADGLRAAQKEAEELGLTFSSIEGVAIENANDSITRMGEAVSGVARRIAVQLAPFIEVAANRFLDFAKQGDVGGQVVSNALNHIAKALSVVANGIQLVITGWQLFATGVKGLGTIIIGVLSKIVDGWNEIFKLVGIDVLQGASNMLQDMTDTFVDSTAESADKLREAAASFGQGLQGEKVKSFFDGIQLEAAKTSSALKMMELPGMGDESGSAKSAEFRQVDLARVSIGGGGSSISTGEKKQIEEAKKTNGYLSIMVKQSRAVVI